MGIEVSVRVKDQIGIWQPDWNCYLLPAPGIINIMNYTYQVPREWISDDTLAGSHVDDIVRGIYGGGYFTDQPGRGEEKQVIVELAISRVGDAPTTVEALKYIGSTMGREPEARPAKDARIELPMRGGKVQGFTSAPPRKPFEAVKLGTPWILPPAMIALGRRK